MAGLQTVRGTHDLFGDDYARHKHIENVGLEIASRYGFSGLSTPIFEFTEVFSRSLGDTTDVVSKEMYSFTDKGGENITLRPEGTAGAVRAFISNGMQQNAPVKLFYAGPMFRYERPQKGRQRQFHQVGVEMIGVAQPQADIEAILLANDFLTALGLAGKIRLELNSLGDAESRNNYREKLVEYFKAYENKLSADSRDRLGRNPMRILDSKEECDKEIVANAPLLSESLNEASKAFINEVTEGLNALGVKFTLNPRLVRGLDYYTHTAFEFITNELGAQGTVLGGGRYDSLVSQMGGGDAPGIGWAAGVERLAMLLEKAPEAPRPIAVIPIGGEAQSKAMEVSYMLRKAGFVVEMSYSGNVGKRMKKANKLNAKTAVLIGGDELAKGVAVVRNLDSGEQVEVAFSEIAQKL